MESEVLAKQDVRGIYESAFSEKLASNRDFVSIIGGEISGPFHGTATASVIAKDNDKVRLVLVSDSRISSGDEEEPDPSAPKEPVKCLDQVNYDLQTRAYLDTQFIESYVKSEIPQFERDFAEAVKRHGVTLVNRSYGQAPRADLVADELDKNCPAPKLEDYYAALGSLLQKTKKLY